MSLTTPSAPALDAAAAFSPLRRVLALTRFGRLTLSLPGGRCIEVAGREPGPHASLRLLSWRPLLRLALQGDLGLALSFRDGQWESPDLLALFEFGLANESAWGSLLKGRTLTRWAARLRHLTRSNSRRGSRHNIAFHYDLGNAFYRHWLDDSMLYSSAMFSDADDDTLEAAQARRLAAIADMLDTPQGADVLEIGCGWGTLAASLARRHEARVTGVTLSSEQLAFARERAQDWGVADRVDLRLQDYRDVQGRFDRIVSIEMIEAVGEAYWPTYFATLRERLKPGGVVVLQAITIADAQFDSYRRGADFIQHCIFPGGMLPSARVLHEQAQRAGLVIETSRCFGKDYARTLAEWRHRFLAAWPQIEPLGFDAAFKRLWNYYLSYCEAGFRAGLIDVGLYRLRAAPAAPA
ncbi:SAM-dependent methyltransferase [Variovorax sp. Root473]|uniref:SAM-dependent methyltransferase n=1 Tax=Variovorax sp. Root473 TaxID=1736541 RepID=UPI0006FA5C9D|nr:cyclopropane-fatty-acyl-phospholipid synthase family protein [Variovorax sp. Root473]KQX87097.1 cyclopropane-fatty-acyl-phospholipid synthase [Variovorax sp. Root473]